MNARWSIGARAAVDVGVRDHTGPLRQLPVGSRYRRQEVSMRSHRRCDPAMRPCCVMSRTLVLALLVACSSGRMWNMTSKPEPYELANTVVGASHGSIRGDVSDA